MRPVRTLVIAAIALIVAATHSLAEEPKLADKLVGTWMLVSAKYGGRESQLPEGYAHLKHVTPAQFTWVVHDKDGTVVAGAGGAYTLKGDAYEETTSYGVGPSFPALKDKLHTFTCRIEGSKWYHTGKLADGLTIEEVWERVERK